MIKILNNYADPSRRIEKHAGTRERLKLGNLGFSYTLRYILTFDPTRISMEITSEDSRRIR